MIEQKIEDIIYRVLTDNVQKNALDFTKLLRANDMAFERGRGYWEDKYYWMIKHRGEYVCFILIGGDGGKDNSWTIWSDDSGSNWFEDCSLDEHTTKIAHENSIYLSARRIRWIILKCSARFNGVNRGTLK
jgi:hypothetical protein